MWLEYSQTRDSAFCYACRHFGLGNVRIVEIVLANAQRSGIIEGMLIKEVLDAEGNAKCDNLVYDLQRKYVATLFNPQHFSTTLNNFQTEKGEENNEVSLSYMQIYYSFRNSIYIVTKYMFFAYCFTNSIYIVTKYMFFAYCFTNSIYIVTKYMFFAYCFTNSIYIVTK